MKIWAIMNWQTGEPKITAINGFACVVAEEETRILLENQLEIIRNKEPKVRFELVEFTAPEKTN